MLYQAATVTAQQAPAQLTATTEKRIVREIDREHETMEEETAATLQIKPIPDTIC